MEIRCKDGMTNKDEACLCLVIITLKLTHLHALSIFAKTRILCSKIIRFSDGNSSFGWKWEWSAGQSAYYYGKDTWRVWHVNEWNKREVAVIWDETGKRLSKAWIAESQY